MLNRGMSAIDRWRKSQAGNGETGSLLGRGIVMLTVLSAVYAVYRLTPALIRGSSNGGAILMMNRTKVHSDSLMYFDGVRHRAVIGAGMVDRRGRRSGGRRSRDVDDDLYDDDDAFYDDDDAAVDDDDVEAGSGRRGGRGGRSRRSGGRSQRGRGSSKGKRGSGSKRAGGGVRGASKSEQAEEQVEAEDADGHAASGPHQQQQQEEQDQQQQLPPAPSPEPPKPAVRKRKALVDVPETAGFVPLQRPLPGEAGAKERAVTADSHRFAELALASQPAPFYLNPARRKPGQAAVAGAEWPYAAAGAGDALLIGDEAVGGDPDVNAELDRRLVVAIGMGE